MTRSLPVSPVRGALGGVGEHVVAPLLVLDLLSGVVTRVLGAHHVSLLVNDLEITMATSLLWIGDMFYTSSLGHLYLAKGSKFVRK